MRLKKNLVLRKVAGENIVVPIGKLSKISPMMQITPAAAWLWEQMTEGDFTEDSLVAAVLGHFSGVDEPQARGDIQEFLKLLDRNYMLENGKPEPISGSVEVQAPAKAEKKIRNGRNA